MVVATAASPMMAQLEKLTGGVRQIYPLSSEKTYGKVRSSESKCGAESHGVVVKAETEDVQAILPPYVSDFGVAGLSGWTVLDGNNDDIIWMVQNNGEVKINYNMEKNMDDWLITPPIKLEVGKAYNVKFAVRAHEESRPERIEVKYGNSNSVKGMTEVVLPATTIVNESAESFEYMLMPDEDGEYYIGFHGISDANMFFLYVCGLEISSGVSTMSPGEATNLKVVPDNYGALNATISFTAPNVTMSGKALAKLTKVEVIRDNSVVKTFENPTPGSALSFEDSVATAGNYTYTVIGYNADGKGMTIKSSAYIGLSVPSDVADLVASRTSNEGEVEINWSAVTTDVNGLQLGSDVCYDVYTFDGYSMNELVAGLTNTSYKYQAAEAGTQVLVQHFVQVRNRVGKSLGVSTDMIPIGTPYAGISESFANSSLSYKWGVDEEGGASWAICGDSDLNGVTSYDNDNGLLVMEGYDFNEYAHLNSGLISLKGIGNPCLTFRVYNVGNSETVDENKITISVLADGESVWKEVLSKSSTQICGENVGWSKVNIDLSDYANQVIQFRLTPEILTYPVALFDDFRVASKVSYDLKVASISAPAMVKTGDSYEVSVTVFNEGVENVADQFSVELYANGSVVESIQTTDLNAGSSEKYVFGLTMSPLCGDQIDYYARVEFEKDENPEDNQTSTISVYPKLQGLPVVKDLVASAKDGIVTLEWDEPDFEGGEAIEVTDDFENAEAFSSEVGNWTFVDVDKAYVGGVGNLNLPGITPGATLGSFWVWDQNVVRATEQADAYSGTKYLFSLFNYRGEASNDWAISPELTGKAQTISFYAKSFDSSCPEKIEVLYSTGSLNTKDFVLVKGSTINSLSSKWTCYSCELPEGAKYFAIRSFAQDAFMLMIDDVTYTPTSVSSNLELSGYNVYRNGEMLNETPLGDCKYVDSDVKLGEDYSYFVTAVFTDKGESLASNIATVNSSGVNDVVDSENVRVSCVDGNIFVTNAEGLEISISSIEGVLIYAGVGESNVIVGVPAGIYIVKAGNKICKLMVE